MYVYIRFFTVDILNRLKSQIDENSLTLNCKGSGRVEIDPGTRTISVYGYSQVR